MEWGIAEIGQLLLYVFALGFPTVWLTGWLYRTWRKANMPAILGVLNRQRRRDATIKETRERASALETFRAESEVRLFEMEAVLKDFEGRVSHAESKVQQLRQKLRSKGILTDA